MSDPIKRAPNGTYEFVIDLGPGLDGKGAWQARRQARRRGFARKDEAKTALAALRVKVDTSAYVPASRLTVREFVEGRWLPAVAAELRPSTLASYRRNLRLHVLPALGQVPLQQLDASQIQRLYAQLLATGRKDHATGKGLSVRTVRYLHTILKAALKTAVGWELLTRNPADGARPPRASSVADGTSPISTWTREQLGAFLDTTSGERLGPLWRFLAMTGCRRGEALGLSWESVDLDEGRVQIRRTLIDADHGVPVWSDPKTARGRRSVQLDAGTIAVLRQLRVAQAAERLAIGAGYTEHGLVFCWPDGRPLHPDRVSKQYVRAAQRHGFPVIRLHDLRHTWATLALEGGVHPKIVSERLGHSNISITLDVYSHVSPAMQSDAAERVAGLILGSHP